jgi:hypothetical protein
MNREKRRLADQPYEHPLVHELMRSLGSADNGKNLILHGDVKTFIAKGLAISNDGERRLVVERLFEFGFFLDVKKGSRAAADAVMAVVAGLMPSFSDLVGAVGEERCLKARDRLRMAPMASKTELGMGLDPNLHKARAGSYMGTGGKHGKG